MLVALLLGVLLPRDAAVGSVTVIAACGFVGDLFLNGLKMLIVPLIGSSLIVAVAGLGAGPGFGRLLESFPCSWW